MSSSAKKLNQRDDLSGLVDYYRNNAEDLRLTRQQLEFEITKRIFTKYIPKNSRILELGAGSGIYTLELLRQGHMVTAYDVTPELIAINEENINETKYKAQANFIVGDARDIGTNVKETFDVVINMGPTYHLTKFTERLKLTSDIKDLLKDGGLSFTTHLTRMGFFGFMMYRHPHWIQNSKEASQFLKKGHSLNPSEGNVFKAHFSTLEEIKDLHTSVDMEVLHLLSQDPGVAGCDDIFNYLPPETKQQWADLLFEMNEDILSLGSGRTIMCICRKTP